MYNLADEGVQFSPTQLFNQMRRGCSASNGQGVQLGRYIHYIVLEKITPQKAWRFEKNYSQFFLQDFSKTS